jgi:hypothetical protein
VNTNPAPRQSEAPVDALPGRYKPQHGVRRAANLSPGQARKDRSARRGWRGAGLFFALGAAFIAAISFVTMAVPGEAGKTLVAGWETNQVGYTAEPQLTGYVDKAMGDWSASSGLRLFPGGSDIRIVFGELLPPIVHDYQAAQANVTFMGEHISYCEVRVHATEFYKMNEFGRQNVITHELGHCLGLDHSDVPSVMMNPRFYAFSNDDAATIAAVYPRTGEQARAPAAESGAAAAAAAPQQPISNLEVSRSQQVGSGAVMSAAAIPAGDPAPFRGTPSHGWRYVIWTDGMSQPAACGCEAVARFDGSAWQHWYAGPGGAAGTLSALYSGNAYWVYNP